MSKSIIQIEKAFSPTVFNIIKEKIFEKQFVWKYNDYLGKDTVQVKAYTDSFFEFSNWPLFRDQRSMPFCFFIESAIISMLDNVNIPYTKLTRIRIGLFTRSGERSINGAHIDDVSPAAISGLIYLTTCNAPTYLYTKFYDPANLNIQNKDLTVEREIPSIENTAVIFEASRYHSSSLPTDINRRITINFTME
jgi:hypothetical protein